MLMPKRTKHRKHHKGRIHGDAKRGHRLVFGEFGLKALEPERIDSRQIEAARRTMVRCLKRAGKVWIRVFPDLSVSSKPAEVRMGSGKGAHDRWACRVRPGKILFELDGVSEELATRAFALADSKLPIKTKIVKKLPCE